MSNYPEHDKLTAVADESQAIGAFLDTSGYTLCEWKEAGNNGEPAYVWEEAVTRATAVRRSPSHADPDLWDYFNGDAVENPEYAEWGDGFYPVPGSIQQILARYFEIDLDVIEAEKRAMLDAIRANREVAVSE